MDEIQKTIGTLKKPLEAALREPSAIDRLVNFEKTVNQAVDRLLANNTFRFTVNMMLLDLKNEFRGFERFDAVNKAAMVDSACRIIDRLEAILENKEAVFLQESEIAEEMKAQAAKDLEKERSRAEASKRQKTARSRAVSSREGPREAEGKRDGGSKTGPTGPAEPGRKDVRVGAVDAAATTGSSSRKKRRPRRRGRSRPNSSG